MEFLKKRVKQYQEKKLQEALDKVKLHQKLKKKLEENDNFDDKIIKEISFHNKMIDVWQKNSEKIKNEMKKIED